MKDSVQNIILIDLDLVKLALLMFYLYNRFRFIK